MTQTFDAWLGTLPKWLQTAAAELLNQNRPLIATEIQTLTDLCVAESKGVAVGFSKVPARAFDAPAPGAQLRIGGIGAIEGVNALDPAAALDFGDADLVVVYGHNGTGKSGFARLAKHAAGAKTRSELLSNVYDVLAPAQKAKFIVDVAGKSETEDWASAGGALESLRHVHIFDADVARQYMTTKAEASYEPMRLRFLSGLVQICDDVRAELTARKGLLPSAMPAIAPNLATSDLAKFVGGLTHKLSREAATKKLTRTAVHADREKALDDALRAPDPAVRVLELNKRLAAFSTSRGLVEGVAVGLSDEKATAIMTAAAEAVRLRTAATNAATTMFSSASLPGVGEPVWRAMWEAARTYSVTAAYRGCAFPHVTAGAHCPLCQQELDEPASQRLGEFETFVKGELESRAKAAETEHAAVVKALPTIPALADWLAHFGAIPAAEQTAASAHAAASARRTALLVAVSAESVPHADLAMLLALIAAEAAVLETERTLLTQAQAESDRPRLEIELRELRMLAWSNTNLPAILAELDRLKKVAALDEASRTTNTSVITKKKADLAQDEITGGYQARFASELRSLGAARIPVKPVGASKGKAKIEFSLEMLNTKRPAAPEKVLSEGEARVVALASFLADVTVAGARTPFVFDDPISSLDQDFEERVVARLLDLARSRQVLVFTHRISLLSLLTDAAKKDRDAARQITGSRPVRFKEIALRRLGNRVGLVTDTNVLESDVEKALNDLINRRLTAAKKLVASGEVDEYTAAMKAICSDVRIVAERAVEEVLLNDVVHRFRRSITTKGKLIGLAKITIGDCKFLDDIMTQFSCFEHSQPQELPAPLPDFNEVREAASALRDWVLAFKKRLADPNGPTDGMA